LVEEQRPCKVRKRDGVVVVRVKVISQLQLEMEFRQIGGKIYDEKSQRENEERLKGEATKLMSGRDGITNILVPPSWWLCATRTRITVSVHTLPPQHVHGVELSCPRVMDRIRCLFLRRCLQPDRRRGKGTGRGGSRQGEAGNLPSHWHESGSIVAFEAVGKAKVWRCGW